MKKFLSVLASVGLTATAASAVVSCGVITKDITINKTDLDANGLTIDNDVRSAYDYVKTNNDIAKKTGNAIQKKLNDDHKKWEKDREGTEPSTDISNSTIEVTDPKGKKHDIVDLNGDGPFKDYQENLKDILIEVTRTKVEGSSDYHYQLASANDEISDIANEGKGQISFSFIRAVDLLSLLNDVKGVNSKTVKGEDGKDKPAPIVDITKIDKDPSNRDTDRSQFNLLDLVSIEYVKSDKSFHGVYSQEIGTIATHLDGDGQGLAKKIFEAGKHRVDLNITVADNKSPVKLSIKTIKEFVD